MLAIGEHFARLTLQPSDPTQDYASRFFKWIHDTDDDVTVNVSLPPHATHSTPSKKKKIYWDLKESLVTAELLLLRILAFETTVETPHPWIVYIMQDVWSAETRQSLSNKTIEIDGLYTEVSTTAIGLANDSFWIQGLVWMYQPR
ncbi:hypothetical protein BCR33DRAFT_112575 [Rhizoclosmatium globosum]|uniref:Uncharacterized protein n=1 Tax=Rhizoclosmatium globosum TaxID=329046 RepID=A0A1Y2CIR6_9FUNG|nr:hypothetical protein BCR33DRAFT_112575 [Rhizoclosmatium globosum]|eukprot:ORY46912.1 hypothetical protein BCR33DRAFT_112575 [Rhizoclosmatium globosum]